MTGWEERSGSRVMVSSRWRNLGFCPQSRDKTLSLTEQRSHLRQLAHFVREGPRGVDDCSGIHIVLLAGQVVANGGTHHLALTVLHGQRWKWQTLHALLGCYCLCHVAPLAWQRMGKGVQPYDGRSRQLPPLPMKLPPM